jgi:alpha-mannosidase
MSDTPVTSRVREIWLVHHTHVDIGYTEPQDAVLRKQAEFLAQVLDFCTATDSRPAGERFVWTCEVSWTVKAFLARFPERAAEFFRRVREGRIEVTALYLQLTDLFTRELLEETADYAFDLGRQNDFEVVTAMNDDVNGWTWGLPDLLAARGVLYMDTAINETRSRGVRPRPALLRWTGPAGGGVLFWHSDGYLHGNGLGLDRPGAEDRVFSYLKRLEQNGYPHTAVEVRMQGANHDNAPPGLWLCEAVRNWNAAHPVGPRFRLATARQWFEHAAKAWSAPVVEWRAGWPDWWADGNGSAAAESALVRRALADLATLKTLTATTGRAADSARIDCAREAAAFFCEHTWGAWCSTDTPDSLSSRSQWNRKAGFAYTAAVEAGSLLQDALSAEAAGRRDGRPGVLVFNPAAHVRSDVVELIAVDADLGLPSSAWLPAPAPFDEGPAFHLVDEQTGVAVAVQREPVMADSARRPARRLRFLARDLPPRALRRYRVVAGELGPATRADECRQQVTTGERGIQSVRDTQSGDPWFSAGGECVLGEVVYETVPGPFGREKICGWSGIRRDAPFSRTSLRFGPPVPLHTPHGRGMRLAACDLPGSLRALTLDVVAYRDIARLDLFYRLDKEPNQEAEALYVAFPLSSAVFAAERPSATVYLDLPGAVLRPGLDQVPGTATDWHSLQHYFAVAAGGRTIVVASPDVPLVQINGINTGKWQEAVLPHNGLVMSWVMNNYWFTNFPAAQGGALAWRYSLQSFAGGFDRNQAERFAAEIRRPLAAVAIQ